MSFEAKLLTALGAFFAILIFIAISVSKAALEETRQAKELCENNGGYFYQQYKSEDLCLESKSVIKVPR